MAERKYEKYILTDINTEADEIGTRLYCLNEEVIKGAPYIDMAWYWPRTEPSQLPVEAHTHDFDEVVTFFGTNPDDPSDLCGEVEFWLEDEQYILTKSCIIFVPRGMQHCPLLIRKAERPIFHFAVSPSGAGYSGPKIIDERE